jgi:iron complex outermembrane recepter protein
VSALHWECGLASWVWSRSMHARHWWRTAAWLTAAAVAPITAHGDAPVGELEQVVILGRHAEEAESYVPRNASTGTKSDTPLKDVPFAVSAVTRAVIDDQLPRTLGEALRNAAGVQPQPGFGALNSNPRIRGFVPNSTLRDGFRQATFVPDVDLATVAQLEVLKGPASALYGRFEPGGVVNIVSKRPQERAHGHVELTGGSDAFYRGTLDAGGPLVADRLLYRFNLVYEDTESYRDFFGMRKALVAPALEWRASDATRVLIDASHTHRDGGFDRGYIVPPDASFGRTLLALPIERNLGEPTDATLFHGSNGRIVAEHRFNARWHGRVAGFWSDTRMHDDFFTGGAPLMPDASTYNRRMLYASDRQRDFTLSAEIAGRATLASFEHRLLFGVDAGEERYVYDAQRVPINSPLNIIAPVYGQASNGPPTVLAFAGTNLYRAAGVFAQDEIALGTKWRALVGGRYDTTEGTSLVIGTPTVQNERTVGAFSPRFGLTFAVAPVVSVYASYARSFVPQIGGTRLDGRMTDPSRGTQYETGIKAESLNGRLLATAAFYDLRKTNVAVSDPENPGFSIQIGEQRSRGAELEVAAQVTSGWSVIASYAHDDAEITRDSNAGLIGNRVVNVPSHTASLWTTYDLPLDATARIRFGAGAFHVSERAVNNANLFFLPGYTRADALVSYRTVAWNLALNLQNVTDRKYFDSSGGVFHPMPPRQWFVTAGYRFLP